MKITDENKPYLIGMVIIAILIAGSIFVLIGMVGETLAKDIDNMPNNNIDEEKENGNEKPFEKEGEEEVELKTVEECLADLGYNKLIYLYTTTCPACRTMTPIVQELVNEGYDIYMADAHKDSNYAKITNCVSIRNSVPQYICNVDGTSTVSIISKEKLIEMYNNC
jgi:thiol-disulfide isomerase/thioredoxin